MPGQSILPLRFLDIWGALECTINTHHGTVRDQLADVGHYSRKNDVQHFARLGIRKMHYPVLWEKHQPDSDIPPEWALVASNLKSLFAAGIEPVAELSHFGNGPAHTNLLDPGFPVKFADYAARVARKFPAIKYYAPVHEPMTTARIRGLYGIWAPYYRDEKAQTMMFLKQVKAIVYAMAAIRKVNPCAELVQTEDVSQINETAVLDEAPFANERRWLTFDLLCGKVKSGHPFWDYFITLGIDENDLKFFQRNVCKPDVIELDCYVTTESALGMQVDEYPEIVFNRNTTTSPDLQERIKLGTMETSRALVERAWQRYHLPMVLTQCCLHAGEQEQVKFFTDLWNTCLGLKNEGIPVLAVTAWSLLGSYDWDSMLLGRNQKYQAGVFDVRSGELRPTMMGRIIQSLTMTHQVK